MRTRVKFCGCTDLADVILAVESGADAFGMIFAASPRRITESAAKHIAEELPPFIAPVGVFVNPTREEILRARAIFPDLVVQLHGTESPSFVSSVDGRVIKTVHVAQDRAEPKALERAANDHPRAAILFDSATKDKAGGTGQTFEWKSLAPLARRREIIVAGGLTPENVGTCVRMVRPYGVDVRSGIESGGKKQLKLMNAFVRAVREADAAA